MDAPAAGYVVLLPFPYSDLSGQKLRPALVLADAQRGDWILCQITSRPYADASAIEIAEADFQTGSLQRISYARPGKLFTANTALFRGIVGQLKAQCHQQIVRTIIALLEQAAPPIPG